MQSTLCLMQALHGFCRSHLTTEVYTSQRVCHTRHARQHDLPFRSAHRMHEKVGLLCVPEEGIVVAIVGFGFLK
jgi:hypothetical protein